MDSKKTVRMTDAMKNGIRQSDIEFSTTVRETIADELADNAVGICAYTGNVCYPETRRKVEADSPIGRGLNLPDKVNYVDIHTNVFDELTSVLATTQSSEGELTRELENGREEEMFIKSVGVNTYIAQRELFKHADKVISPIPHIHGLIEAEFQQECNETFQPAIDLRTTNLIYLVARLDPYTPPLYAGYKHTDTDGKKLVQPTPDAELEPINVDQDTPEEVIEDPRKQELTDDEYSEMLEPGWKDETENEYEENTTAISEDVVEQNTNKKKSDLTNIFDAEDIKTYSSEQETRNDDPYMAFEDNPLRRSDAVEEHDITIQDLWDEAPEFVKEKFARYVSDHPESVLAPIGTEVNASGWLEVHGEPR